ncbi:MAG: ABC transporter substrate-binding protein, partial [Dehalococcoidia bacterium]|nr:ABC transporter substrate-binding protein [Dehalococcoidia bacterium]
GPVAEERETLLINHGGYGPAVVGCGKYTFHLPANELVLIRAMLDYAKKNLGVKTLGLIYVNDDMGISVRNFIKGYCPKIGITYKGEEAFDLAATDYSAQIAKARGWKADAIYLSVHKHPVTKQANEAGFHPQWIGCPLYTLSEFLKWGPGIEGALSAAADVSFERNPGMVKLKENWEKKYGAGTFPKGGVSYIADGYNYPYMVKDMIQYGLKQKWPDYWTGKRLRQALVEIRTFRGPSGEITFSIKEGTSSRNIAVFRPEPDPAVPGTYKWKEVAYYPASKVAALP